ncbi:MAG: NAD(P)H-hydrate dehydratase [Odoribacteraceae bacterium]|nr:NAD(P)H-hydrate dehydratase [Odoribacteraceae bacterium]
MEYRKIFRAAELKALDEYTIRHEPVSDVELMERAATAFTNRLLQLYPVANSFNILAGTGNNGGDGFAIARQLMARGKHARVYLARVGEELSPCCAVNRERFREVGGEEEEAREFAPGRGEVWVDALFGSGLNRPTGGWVADAIRRLNDMKATVVAVDVPSGLMCDDNRENGGEIVRATRTLTFHCPKLALMLEESHGYAGEFEVLDIGLSREGERRLPSSLFYLTREAVAGSLPRVDKFAHKGRRGHALLVAGSDRFAGAAALATRGALRSGAGLVTVHVPKGLKGLMHASAPEALVSVDADDGHFTGIGTWPGCDAVGIGPGMGTDPESAAATRALLERWRGPTVVDADALNVLAANPEWLEGLPRESVLTPHAAEFDRLSGRVAASGRERLEALVAFARRYRVHVVLKGAHAVVATPGGECFFNMTGNAGMAKGGTGDVLTGVIASVLAGGAPLPGAVTASVFAHGLAGDLAAAEHGERGVTSGDVAAMMGRAWRVLEEVSRDK